MFGRSPLRISGLLLACSTAAAAAATPTVRLDGDELRIDIGGEALRGGGQLIFQLGPHQSAYDPPRIPERSWRRSGRSESEQMLAAVMVRRQEDSFAVELEHVFVLGPGGALVDMKRKAGRWISNLQTQQPEWSRRLQTIVADEQQQSWTGTPFVNCWDGQTSGMKQMRVGLALDQGFLNEFVSETACANEIENWFSQSNLIYENQLNVHLAIGLTLLPNQSPWKEIPMSQTTECAQDVTGRFANFTLAGVESLALTWRMSAWVYFSNACPPTGNTLVGYARIGGLCDYRNAYAIVTNTDNWPDTHTAPTWQTLAHELGHVFGASHSFEDGRGTTGGIMDYGDGKYNGEFQFNPNRKIEVCETIDMTMHRQTEFHIIDCWKPFNRNLTDPEGSWAWDDWTNCDVSCVFDVSDKGKQYKEPACRDTLNRQILDQYCPGTRPNSQERDCDPNPPLCDEANRWTPAEWGNCTSPFGLDCGVGERRQELECNDANGPTPGNCSQIPLPELPTRFCQFDACAEPAVWGQLRNFSASTTCLRAEATGFNLLQVACVNVNTNGVIPEEQCSGNRPLSIFEESEAPAECEAVSDVCCIDKHCRNYNTSQACMYGTPRMDAMVCLERPFSDSYAYTFFGAYYRKESKCLLDEQAGPVARLSAGFPGFPASWDRIDAVMTTISFNNEELIFFRDNSVWKFSLATHRARAGYPKLISEEFEGLGAKCPRCAEKVSVGYFDEQQRRMYLWCGVAGDHYCTARENPIHQWEWSYRPTLDFRIPELHGMFKDSVDGLIAVNVDRSLCKAALGTSCKPVQKDLRFAQEDQPEQACADIPNCAACSGGECSTCEPGYKPWYGRCGHYQTELWLAEPRAFPQGNEFKVSGARDLGDYQNNWAGDYQNGGPWAGLRYLPASTPREMAPVINDTAQVAQLRNWALNAWVRGRNGASGDLIRSPQPDGKVFKIGWSSCGPSVYLIDGSTEDVLAECDMQNFGVASNGEWVQIGMAMGRNLVLTVAGHEIKFERPEALVSLSFDQWTMGGADIDVGSLQILDLLITTPRDTTGWSLDSLILNGVALGFGVTVLSLMGCTYKVKVPKTVKIKNPNPMVRVARFYILFMNGMLVTAGAAMIVALAVFLAFQGLGWSYVRENWQEISDLNGALYFIGVPLRVGILTIVMGLLGMRAARTRDGCTLIVSLFLLGFCIAWAAWMYLLLIGASLPGSDKLVDFGTKPALVSFRNTLSNLMSIERYDCVFASPEMAGCDTSLDLPLLQCRTPTGDAQTFENIINIMGANKFYDVAECADCVQNFGSNFNLPDGDWLGGASTVDRVFCKCITNLLGRGKQVFDGSVWALGFIVASWVLLLLELWLYFCVKSNRDQFKDQLKERVDQYDSFARNYNLPKWMRRHAQKQRASFQADAREIGIRLTEMQRDNGDDNNSFCSEISDGGQSAVTATNSQFELAVAEVMGSKSQIVSDSFVAPTPSSALRAAGQRPSLKNVSFGGHTIEPYPPAKSRSYQSDAYSNDSAGLEPGAGSTWWQTSQEKQILMMPNWRSNKPSGRLPVASAVAITYPPQGKGGGRGQSYQY